MQTKKILAKTFHRISANNINTAKKFTKNFESYIEFYVKDSLIFLKEFNESIDLLYLDSLDGHDPIAASHHQYRFLSQRS